MVFVSQEPFCCSLAKCSQTFATLQTSTHLCLNTWLEHRSPTNDNLINVLRIPGSRVGEVGSSPLFVLPFPTHPPWAATLWSVQVVCSTACIVQRKTTNNRLHSDLRLGVVCSAACIFQKRTNNDRLYSELRIRCEFFLRQAKAQLQLASRPNLGVICPVLPLEEKRRVNI